MPQNLPLEFQGSLSKYDKRKVCALAAYYIAQGIKRGDPLESPEMTEQYLKTRLTYEQNEQFVVLFLDTRHRVIECKTMFTGTIDGATVYPRVVVTEALYQNAAAVIIAHNHPSGIAEPSLADQAITRRLKDALALVDIRLLDHMVVAGGSIVSMASKGMI